jgi:glycosyltransferase involved in cell wall biosynthesis
MSAVPLVSVLLPVRNARATLAECLRSLSRQTMKDYEVIAVDDGSGDGSREILARASATDRRVRVVGAAGRGLASALNTGLDLARGLFVARMDADDIADPDRLLIQARRLISDPSTGILGCRVRLLGGLAHGSHGMRAYVRWLNGLLDHEAIVRDLFVESPLAHPSVMMRRPALRALGGYREFDGPEDYDLWLRAHRAGVRFAKVPEKLLFWRDGPFRLTRTDRRYSAERFRALKIEALEGSLLPPSRGVVIWGAGPIGKGWAKALGSRGHRLLAFVEVDPRKIGQDLLGAPVLSVAEARLFGPLHLAAVGLKGAREKIRAEAARLGLLEGRDLLAVA